MPTDSGSRSSFSVIAPNQENIVPEPTTLISGALLPLPFGATSLRILRKKMVAS